VKKKNQNDQDAQIAGMAYITTIISKLRQNAKGAWRFLR